MKNSCNIVPFMDVLISLEIYSMLLKNNKLEELACLCENQ
jgi:hypothetical protein